MTGSVAHLTLLHLPYPIAIVGFMTILAILSCIDLRTRRLPDRIVLPALWIGLLLNAFSVLTTPTQAILGAAAGYAGLWALSATWSWRLGASGNTYTTAIGCGDMKMAAMIGAWLGLGALPAALLLAFAGGTLAVFPLVMIGRCRAGQQVPFGPALAVGAAIIGVVGPAPILNWFAL